LKSVGEKVWIADGAMGTMLYSRGIFINRCFDELNLSMPGLVKEVHRDYVEAGAEIIETNTFGANRFKLKQHGLEGKLHQINLRGAELAGDVAGEDVLVAGSIGPLGIPLEPIGKLSAEEAKVAFREQAKALLEGGIDLFALETFSGLEELREACRAVREVSDLPVIAMVQLTEELTTPLGHPVSLLTKRFEEWGVDVGGFNCSTGPVLLLEGVKRMRDYSDLPLAVMPNAGFPRVIEDRVIYLSSPEYFAEYAKQFIQSGISVIGGCCGTTPQHVAAVKKAVRAAAPSPVVKKKKRQDGYAVIAARGMKPVPQVERSGFGKKLTEGRFVVSVEIDPPRGTSIKKILEKVGQLKERGVDAVNVADGPRASARMSPMALANALETSLGVETILHFTCRDRNLLGMQSDLLGSHVMGLRNLLLVTGDPPKLGDYPDATAVFDVDSIGLIKIVQRLNRGLDAAENPIGEQTSFLVGAALNPAAVELDNELGRFEEKVEAGADFVMTQPIYDTALLDRVLRRIERFKVPVIVGILPLASFKNAEFLHNEVPGMSVPEEIRERLRRASSGQEAKGIGIEIARQALLEAKEMVQGVYVMPPFGRIGAALSVLEVL
jgi:homocysteine S-methyltransferase